MSGPPGINDTDEHSFFDTTSPNIRVKAQQIAEGPPMTEAREIEEIVAGLDGLTRIWAEPYAAHLAALIADWRAKKAEIERLKAENGWWEAEIKAQRESYSRILDNCSSLWRQQFT